jgi:hypothetical protein
MTVPFNAKATEPMRLEVSMANARIMNKLEHIRIEMSVHCSFAKSYNFEQLSRFAKMATLIVMKLLLDNLPPALQPQ